MKLSKLTLTALFFTAATAQAAPNAQMKSVLNELSALNPKPIETLSAAEARLQPNAADAVRMLLAKSRKAPSTEGLTVYDTEITGAAGPLKARVYQPAGKEPMPVVLYFHGGGWVLADLDTYESSAVALAKKAKAIVLAVEYRKAPENKFPAAHDDAYAAYRWLLDNAGSVKGDGKRIAVAGESAGGSLAFHVSQQAKADGIALPVQQLLIYPVAGNDMVNESYLFNKNAKPLNKHMMKWFFAQYLNNEDEANDPRINILSADMRGLPPTTVITAEIDPLRTEGELLAKALKDQGVKVSAKDYAGVTHEFFGMDAVLKEAGQAQDFAAKRLRAEF